MARKAGLLSPHGPREYGGLGLDHRGMAVVFEAAGWSPLGPLALNIQAPDEGNTNLLNIVATPEQKKRYLEPLVRGEIRTVFCMTEPDGCAGSDPSLIKTTARQVGKEWVIDGIKWLITGAPGAGSHQLPSSPSITRSAWVRLLPAARMPPVSVSPSLT